MIDWYLSDLNCLNKHAAIASIIIISLNELRTWSWINFAFLFHILSISSAIHSFKLFIYDDDDDDAFKNGFVCLCYKLLLFLLLLLLLAANNISTEQKQQKQKQYILFWRRTCWWSWNGMEIKWIYFIIVI